MIFFLHVTILVYTSIDIWKVSEMIVRYTRKEKFD